MSFEEVVAQLKQIYARGKPGTSGDPELAKIIAARDEVVPGYQVLFAKENLQKITAEEFRAFLIFRNNQHWLALQRMGPAICKDMQRLRKALEILTDETRPIDERMNELVPPTGPAFVPRLHKAVLTPILLIAYPDLYGVWNQVSENAMKALDVWPDFDRGVSFGERYLRVNSVLLELREAVGVDLWTLDGLLWRAVVALVEPIEEISVEAAPQEQILAEDLDTDRSRFSLERHLQYFLRDNWDQTELASEWQFYEEDGDPEAGFEYPCGKIDGKIGRIDLLARHKSERRWLIIELKRDQGSDPTVGQVARYMGWVQEHLAEPGDSVEGLIVARHADKKLRYAVKMVPNVRVKLYEVNFRLQDPGD